MLVLSRKKNESVVINDNIRIEILQIKGKQIRLGITAPSSMKILRGELPVFDVADQDQTATAGGSPASKEADDANRSVCYDKVNGKPDTKVMEESVIWSTVISPAPSM